MSSIELVDLRRTTPSQNLMGESKFLLSTIYIGQNQAVHAVSNSYGQQHNQITGHIIIQVTINNDTVFK